MSYWSAACIRSRFIIIIIIIIIIIDIDIDIDNDNDNDNNNIISIIIIIILTYLFQRLSVVLQRFNAVLLRDSFPLSDASDLWSSQ